MKTLQFISSTLTSLSLVFLLAACPGPQGEPGPAGTNGTNGRDGNANVIQFTFGSRVFNPLTNNEVAYTLTGITADIIGKSALLLYLQNGSGYWYPIPGVFDGSYEYRTIIRPSANSVVAVRRTDNTTISQTFNATRIIIIQASDIRNGRKANIDYSSYEEVKKAYNLPD